jgi:hypothetical protein
LSFLMTGYVPVRVVIVSPALIIIMNRIYGYWYVVCEP